MPSLHDCVSWKAQDLSRLRDAKAGLAGSKMSEGITAAWASPSSGPLSHCTSIPCWAELREEICPSVEIFMDRVGGWRKRYLPRGPIKPSAYVPLRQDWL